VLESLAYAGRPLSTAALEPTVELSRSRLEMVLKVLDVDGAVRRVRGGWESTGQPWEYDRERYARVSSARTAEQDAMLGYIATTGCRMEYLRHQLDDPDAVPCGRCDNCTGQHWDTSVSEEVAGATRERLDRPGVAVAPRKQWPSGMSGLDVPLSGRIAAGDQAETGQVLGRLTDVGWGSRLRELLGPDAADVEMPGGVFQACVKVLAGWQWAERPVAVVEVPSVTRPRLTHSLATKLSDIGRLEFLGSLDSAGPPPRQANSAQRLADLWRRLSLPEDVAARVAAAAGPILLVDDVIDTGWTMTLGTRLLRRAGAKAVLPFALASTS
ncbi:MAG: RecQ family zinc-binding domain-containing protein, partial [Acidimicrobiales bacterium]